MKYKVYKITTKDGLVYIGQTCNLRKRVREHANTKPELKIGFDVEVLFEFDSREESLAKERELVNEDFIRMPTTLNVVLGGGGTPPVLARNITRTQ